MDLPKRNLDDKLTWYNSDYATIISIWTVARPNCLSLENVEASCRARANKGSYEPGKRESPILRGGYNWRSIRGGGAAENSHRTCLTAGTCWFHERAYTRASLRTSACTWTRLERTCRVAFLLTRFLTFRIDVYLTYLALYLRDCGRSLFNVPRERGSKRWNMNAKFIESG